MASGWTGYLIAPDQRVHTAAAAAIDHVGAVDAQQATTNPAHPDHQSIMASYVLRDPRLGSRNLASVNPTPGTPVGSASTFQNSGIPATIQSAIGNLQTNTTTGYLMQILNRVLGNQGGGAQNVNSPAQEDFYKSQTALNNQRLATQAAPGNIQNQINQNLSSNANPTGIMTISPALPGSYEGSQQQANNNALVNLYGSYNNAKQAASGWTV